MRSEAPLFSLELFPVKTAEGLQRLKTNVEALRAIDPHYVSVTYGAGGSTRDRTCELVQWLVDVGVEAAPHLSCVGSTREELIGLMDQYVAMGISRLVAIRGDLPSGAGLGGLGELRHANELVELVRQHYGDHFYVEVAAYPEYHPQAKNPKSDLDYFVKKMRAGANSAITQYFYNIDAYFRFVENSQKAGINQPIVPGIMPITNYSSLVRFSDNCGAEIPRWIRKQLESYHDDIRSIKAFGVEVVSKLCRDLLDSGVPGLHFYTMNQSESVLKIWNNIQGS